MSTPSSSEVTVEQKIENEENKEDDLTPESVEKPEQSPDKPEKVETAAEEVKFFRTKKIRFGPIDYQIVTQNANGPCPLIALVNALVLKGKIEIPPNYAINSKDLLNLLTNLILWRVPTSDDDVETYENNLRDVLTILPTIVNGLDVNVQ
uniref:Ubiquitin carboxyl-terminal hydrolase n=2 Tax=Caenorhabditis japonica TaxID=281687 RepID=A0A8R1ECT9_CAEJA